MLVVALCREFYRCKCLINSLQRVTTDVLKKDYDYSSIDEHPGVSRSDSSTDYEEVDR